MRLTALAAIFLALAAVAGCGGGGERSGDPDESVSSRAATGTLRLGEFAWSAARLTNAILEEIVARHPELGIDRVERVDVSPDEGWFQLETGGLDVLTEVYLPNQQGFASKAKAETELVHRIYDGAVNAWFVPRYAVEPGGAAAGLRRVDQLDRYADAFGRTLYDGEPGWVTTEQNEDRIEGFGLDLEHETGTEEELIAALKRHYRQRRPILIYLWRPHWVHSAFDLVELEEPNPYSVDCFGESKIACAMPTNDVWVAARKDLMERAPQLWKLLGSFEVPIADLEAMLFSVDGKGTPPREAARRWVARNSATIDGWLKS